MAPGVTAGAWVGATCSGCARKVTGTEGCERGGERLRLDRSGRGRSCSRIWRREGVRGKGWEWGEPKQEFGALLKLENQLFVVGLQVCMFARRSRKTARWPWVFPGSEIGLAGSCDMVSGFSVGSRPAPGVLAPRGGMPGVAVWSAKSPRIDSTLGMSSMFARAVLAVYRSSRELGESGVWAPAMLVSKRISQPCRCQGKAEGRLHWSRDWWGRSVEEDWIQAWISGRQLQSPTHRSKGKGKKKKRIEVRAYGRGGGGGVCHDFSARPRVYVYGVWRVSD